MLLCLVVFFTLLASFFLTFYHIYIHVHVCMSYVFLSTVSFGLPCFLSHEPAVFFRHLQLQVYMNLYCS